jgi:hypothetical protein
MVYLMTSGITNASSEANPTCEIGSTPAENGQIFPVFCSNFNSSHALFHFGCSLASVYLVCHSRSRNSSQWTSMDNR